MTIATCTRCSTSLHYHRGSLDDQLNPRRICKKCRVRALSAADELAVLPEDFGLARRVGSTSR